MSATRLLVLGAVRIFQPAHGYLVRRELTSWQAHEWANLNPGSVYNALRSLARDGLLAEGESEHGVGLGANARTTYRLTDDGETDFQRLVRLGLWQLHPYDPAWLLASLSFWSALSRQEVLAALDARRKQVESRVTATGFAADTVRNSPFKPESVVEHFLLHADQLQGELLWVNSVSRRIRDGAYWFLGEAGAEVPAAAASGPTEHPTATADRSTGD
jgi:DNA-binding PadR family transcriptional regulator